MRANLALGQGSNPQPRAWQLAALTTQISLDVGFNMSTPLYPFSRFFCLASLSSILVARSSASYFRDHISSLHFWLASIFIQS